MKILKRHLNKTVVVEDIVIEKDGKLIETTRTITTFYPPEDYYKSLSRDNVFKENKN